MRTRILVLLLVLASCAGSAAGGKHADILLVERPELLVVLNAFQRTASAEEVARLHPYAPMVVRRTHEMLPDGFTACMVVDVDGETFYLVQETSGQLVNAHAAGSLRIIRGVELAGDSVRAAGEATIRTEDGRHIPVVRGSMIREEFSAGGNTYVRIDAAGVRYGWIATSVLAAFPVPSARGASPAFTPAGVRAAIRQKLATTNAALTSLYTFFSRQTGEALPVPQWRCIEGKSQLQCLLDDPAQRGRMERSARLLATDLENLLMGSGCRVDASPGIIVVHLP